jgi:uncharacterized protein (TIGR02145 family)
MKKILLFIAGLSFLFSCQQDVDLITTVSKEITSDYLLNGNLDIYLQNNQIFRYTGKPGIELISIGNKNLSDYEDCFVLYVSSGSQSTSTVSSAIVKLDGIEVLNTSEFSNSSITYTFEICKLTDQSYLEVEVRGAPGSCIDIWIEGKLKTVGTVTDGDLNTYNTFKIGNQWWMAENLKTTRFCNGDLIGTTDPFSLDIRSESAPLYQWAYNGNESNVTDYGRIYSWYAISDSRNVCPCGWHVPTNDEWSALLTYLGGSSIAGSKLKEAGTTHWLALSGATNESGFTARPGGYRRAIGTYSFMGDSGYWWSSSIYNTSNNSWYYMDLHSTNVYFGYSRIIDKYSFAVRCIKD